MGHEGCFGASRYFLNVIHSNTLTKRNPMDMREPVSSPQHAPWGPAAHIPGDLVQTPPTLPSGGVLQVLAAQVRARQGWPRKTLGWGSGHSLWPELTEHWALTGTRCWGNTWKQLLRVQGMERERKRGRGRERLGAGPREGDCWVSSPGPVAVSTRRTVMAGPAWSRASRQEVPMTRPSVLSYPLRTRGNVTRTHIRTFVLSQMLRVCLAQNLGPASGPLQARHPACARASGQDLPLSSPAQRHPRGSLHGPAKLSPSHLVWNFLEKPGVGEQREHGPT